MFKLKSFSKTMEVSSFFKFCFLETLSDCRGLEIYFDKSFEIANNKQKNAFLNKIQFK